MELLQQMAGAIPEPQSMPGNSYRDRNRLDVGAWMEKVGKVNPLIALAKRQAEKMKMSKGKP